MARQIHLNEAQLQKIISNSVAQYLNENVEDESIGGFFHGIGNAVKNIGKNYSTGRAMYDTKDDDRINSEYSKYQPMTRQIGRTSGNRDLSNEMTQLRQRANDLRAEYRRIMARLKTLETKTSGYIDTTKGKNGNYHYNYKVANGNPAAAAASLANRNRNMRSKTDTSYLNGSDYLHRQS